MVRLEGDTVLLYNMRTPIRLATAVEQAGHIMLSGVGHLKEWRRERRSSMASPAISYIYCLV